MAIQKKSLIGKRQSVKKALVAQRVSADAPKATQVKAPYLSGLPHKHNAPYLAGPHNHKAPYLASPTGHKTPYLASPTGHKTPYTIK